MFALGIQNRLTRSDECGGSLSLSPGGGERPWRRRAARAEIALVNDHLLFFAVGPERTRAFSILLLNSGLTRLSAFCSYSLLVEICPATGAEPDPVKSPITSCSFAQLLATRPARWPIQEIFVIAFRLKIRRAAFWAEPDDLTVRIKLAGGTDKLR